MRLGRDDAPVMSGFVPSRS